MTDTPSVEQFAQATAATDALIVGVKDDQWSDPTPCADWSVHDLVNHLVFGCQVFGDLLRGELLPPIEEIRRLSTVDHLGDDPVRAYRDASASMQAAFSEPGALTRDYIAPTGPASGLVVLNLRISEALVHGWDLAKATGQQIVAPDDLAEHVLAFNRWYFDYKLPRAGRFGAAQPVADEAPAIERLAAYLGRSVAATRTDEFGSPTASNR